MNKLDGNMAFFQDTLESSDALIFGAIRSELGR